MSQDVPIGKAHVSLAQLNDRSRDIFRQIVESYLATGEPVGSRNLARLITTPLSPASVRNVMSDLEQLGLIYAPHTSAGRLPTELGLRFFIDALMEIGDISAEDRKAMEAKVAAAGRSMEAVLSEATGMLSGLTRAAGVVLTAKQNLRLKHIEFVRLEPDRALVVLVADDGQVENRVIELPVGLPSSALNEASNFLNAHVRGRTLLEAKVELEKALEAQQRQLDALTQKIIATGNEVELSFGTVGALQQRLDAGETADVVISAKPAIEALEKAGRLALKSRAGIATVRIGVAVRAGAPAPDISTPEAFRQALVDARAVAFSDAAVGGSAGVYLARMFAELGLADAIKKKGMPQQNGGEVARRVAEGKADIGMTLIAEIVPITGVRVIGPLPKPLGSDTTYCAGVMAMSNARGAALDFIAALKRKDRHTVWKEAGFEVGV